MSKVVTAYAPASIGNLGVGFDMLGLALEGAGDRVSARRVDTTGISVAEVRGPDGKLHPVLSTNPLETRRRSLLRRFGMRNPSKVAPS